MDLAPLANPASVAVWGVSALAVLAILARALRRREGRSVWVPAALAAAALCLSTLPPALRGARLETVWAPALTLAATPLLVLSLMGLLRLHHAVDRVRAPLDVLGGALILAGVVLAVASGPVQRASGLDQLATSLLLAGPASVVIAALTTLVGLHVAEAMRTARAQLFAGALVVLAAAESAALLEEVVLLPDAGPLDVHAVGAALTLALLAGAAWVPAEPVVPKDETARAVMLGPVVQLVVVAALLAADHAVGLPTAAIVLALTGMGLQLVCILLVYRLITSLSGSREQALTDELTGLGNRRALSAALRRVGGGQSVSLALVDLDRFKEVNDVLGHDAGDELLRQVAARLLVGAGPDEVVVRQGGDEFALVRPRCSAAATADRAAGVVAALQAPFVLGGHEVSVSASVGVAASPEHAVDAEELLRAADSAMYRAKAAGGGVLVHDAASDAARRADLDLLADLRGAVAEDRLCVHFQPQLEAATGALVGVEALVRWQHPTRGMLAPLVFLPLAEKHGLMDALTRSVLAQALAAKRLIDGGTGSRMSVNISATSLLDPHLVTTVASLLQEHAVPPAELILEITETELMLDAAVSRRVVCELVALGVGVSIDDYGTGHSSLSYLKDLPATELKLDRSFIAELGADPRIATIVRSTVDLAHSLGLRLVAEGVEDGATLEELVTLDVDVTQGYHHSRPVPAEDLARWAAERRGVHAAR